MSILMATRNRPHLLAESLDSLYSLAKDKSLVEFIFKIDDDDRETIAMVLELSRHIPCRTIVSPRGAGYAEIHRYVNEMSAIARGDWLFIFNDDARILTQDWDQVLLNLDPSSIPKWGGNEDVCLVAPTVIERDVSWEFPILRRKAFELMGHFSMTLSNDSWIYWVLSGLNAALILPDIRVTHFVNDLKDQVNVEGRKAIEDAMPSLNSPDMKAIRAADRETLRAYIVKKREGA